MIPPNTDLVTLPVRSAALIICRFCLWEFAFLLKSARDPQSQARGVSARTSRRGQGRGAWGGSRLPRPQQGSGGVPLCPPPLPLLSLGVSPSATSSNWFLFYGC